MSALTGADELGLAKSTILRILSEAGVTMRPQGRRLP